MWNRRSRVESYNLVWMEMKSLELDALADMQSGQLNKRVWGSGQGQGMISSVFLSCTELAYQVLEGQARGRRDL